MKEDIKMKIRNSFALSENKFEATKKRQEQIGTLTNLKTMKKEYFNKGFCKENSR